MKLEIKDNKIYVDGRYDGFFNQSPVVDELARRVNGWEGLVKTLKGIANEHCLCVFMKGLCGVCRSREALRKAGVE